MEESKSLMEEKEGDKNTIVTLSPNQLSKKYAEETFRPIQSSSSSNKRTKKGTFTVSLLELVWWKSFSWRFYSLAGPINKTQKQQNIL